jgi:hypothetical protein
MGADGKNDTGTSAHRMNESMGTENRTKELRRMLSTHRRDVIDLDCPHAFTGVTTRICTRTPSLTV